MEKKKDSNTVATILTIITFVIIALICSFANSGSSSRSSSSSKTRTDKQIEKSTGGTYQKKNGKWYYTGKGVN